MSANKNELIRKLIPDAPDISLYNTGESDIERNIPGVPIKPKATITVDTLILSFIHNYTPYLQKGLVNETLPLNSFTYCLSENSVSNIYRKSAQFYYKKLLIGNLSFDCNKSIDVFIRNRMTFRLEKALFYGKHDWTKILMLLLEELNIEQYTVSRLDIAVDVDWGVLTRYQYLYLDTRWRRASKSKKKPNMIIEPEDGRLSSLRISLDAHRKNIVIYEKDSSPQLYRQEEKQTPVSDKEIQPYQIDYWSANGLNTELVERVEIRLGSKYTKEVKLNNLRKRDFLLTQFKAQLGNHLSFRNNTSKQRNVSRIPMIDSFPVDELTIGGKSVLAKRVYQFHLPADIGGMIKNHFYAKKVTVVKSITNKIGLVDIGDGLKLKVIMHPKNAPGRFHWEKLFTDKAIMATDRFPVWDADYDKAEREYFEKYGDQPNPRAPRTVF